MEIISIIDSGIKAILNVVHTVRGGISAAIGQYSLLIFLGLGLYLAYLFLKKFITSPFNGRYILWYLLLSLIFFFTLNYI